MTKANAAVAPPRPGSTPQTPGSTPPSPGSTPAGPGATPAGPVSTLAELINPVTVADFIGGYWDRRALTVQRERPEFFAPLLTLDDMDRMLCAASPSDAEVVLGGRRQPLGQKGYPETLFAHYRQGATIALRCADRSSVPLRLLCQSLARELSAALQVVAYLTPASTQGFTTHHDTHDVFVAQIHGSKRWRLYHPVREFPETDELWAAPHGWRAEPAAEILLRQGDLLYLPRGTPHDAVSTDTASLHLTIGVHPVTWAAVIRQAVNQAVAADSRYRRALPAGFATSAEPTAAAAAAVQRLVRELTENLGTGAAVTAAADRVLSAATAPLHGYLRDLESVRSIGADTKVQRRPGLIVTLRADRDAARLAFNGKTLGLPARVLPELEFAAAGSVFTARDLPGTLDVPGRVTLVTTLVREGFLTRGE